MIQNKNLYLLDFTAINVKLQLFPHFAKKLHLLAQQANKQALQLQVRQAYKQALNLQVRLAHKQALNLQVRLAHKQALNLQVRQAHKQALLVRFNLKLQNWINQYHLSLPL